MSRAEKLLHRLNEVFDTFSSVLAPLQPEEVKKAFERRLEYFGFDNVLVDYVEVYQDGDIVVAFSDLDGEQMLVLFGVDEYENSYAIVLDDDMEDDDENTEVTEIGLDPMLPVLVNTPFGKYLNLVDLNWLNKSTFTAMFSVGDIDASMANEDLRIEKDETSEAYKIVVRGGKKVRLPLVRRVIKKRLTAKQRTGIRKGVMTRKSRSGQIKRKLKRSLQVRKNLGVKSSGNPKGYRLSTGG